MWAILITIASLCFCCVIGTIPGIVAIVFASQVNSKLNAGDRAGAGQASRNAKLWCWITTGLAILGLLLNDHSASAPAACRSTMQNDTAKQVQQHAGAAAE